MTLIKTFDEFKKPPIIDEAREVTKISAATPETGELKRWNVVLRSGTEGAVDVANPSNTILRELSQDPDFKKWWMETNTNANSVKIPNHNSLAIIDLGVSNKTNLIGQKVFKAQVAFLPYSDQLRGKKDAMEVMYDVTKTPHRASHPVEGSNFELAAWNKTDLPALTVKTPIEAKDKNTGKFVTVELVGPAYMEKNGAPNGVATLATPSPDNSVTTTTTAAGTTPAGTTPAGTTTKVGLKSSNVFSQEVKDLQNKILANGGDAAAKIKAVGGADGKYGNATATAIGILTGTPTVPVIDITQDIADKLNTVLKDVKVAAPVVKPDTTKKPTGKKQASADPGF